MTQELAAVCRRHLQGYLRYQPLRKPQLPGLTGPDLPLPCRDARPHRLAGARPHRLRGPGGALTCPPCSPHHSLCLLQHLLCCTPLSPCPTSCMHGTMHLPGPRCMAGAADLWSFCHPFWSTPPRPCRGGSSSGSRLPSLQLCRQCAGAACPSASSTPTCIHDVGHVGCAAGGVLRLCACVGHAWRARLDACV